MQRSLASLLRVKTAQHILNIAALNQEIQTYSINGLLKAASVGQSKEACLKYAGLHAAMLIEKRAVDDYAAMFKQGAAGGPAQPPRKPTQMSGFGAPNPIQLKPTASPSGGGGGGYTGGNYTINTKATTPSTAPSDLTRSFVGGIADSQKNYPQQAPGLTVLSPGGGARPALNNAGTASRRQAPAPLTAGVIPKPPASTYTEDPVEAAYSKQLNIDAAKAMADKNDPYGAAPVAKKPASTGYNSTSAATDEDYMRSIEPSAPVSAPTPTPAPKAAPYQRQQIIGSGAPVRTLFQNVRGRRKG